MATLKSMLRRGRPSGQDANNGQNSVDPSTPDWKKKLNETFNEDFWKSLMYIAIAFVIALVIKSLSMRLVGDNLGVVWGIIVAFLVAILLLLATSSAFPGTNKRVATPLMTFLVLLFALHCINLIGEHRKEKKEEAKQEQASPAKGGGSKVAPVPVTVDSTAVELKFGVNKFELKDGESTPTLRFPTCSKFNYSIGSEKLAYRTYYSDGTNYGPSDVIPHKVNPVFKVKASADDEIIVFVMRTGGS